MDFITSIVSGVVVKIAETTVVPLYRQVGYVIHYKSNLQNLRDQVENLGCAKDRMQHTLDDEVKRKGKRVEHDVENWLTKVDEITQEVDVFLQDECHAKTKCFHGFCPNPILRYQFSRKSTKLVQKVEFHEKREFTTLSYNIPPQDVCSIQSRDYLAFESRLSIVKDIMEKLRNPDTNMIDLEGIQKQILEKLDMEVVDGQTIAKRASLLWDRIKHKRVLIILDDIPERIDLETMGVWSVPTCNIMVTARNRRVLYSEMRTQEDFLLDVLGEIETWSLFEKVAGDIVKENPIRTIAIEVAKKCGGLPILVVAVASALRISTLHEWKDALRRLKKFDMKELAEKAMLTLEWSYNQLDAEELKPLFLLCGIIAWRSNKINLNDCFKYSMGLGLLKQVDTMEEAQAAFHSLIKRLQNYCLLLEQQDGIYSTVVRMHELVRNVAIMIARRDQHVLIRESEELFEEWPNKAFFKKCTMIWGSVATNRFQLF
ncbi:disease resistance protein At4g27190-like [Rosa chinensis]|uniref:disease resistance protein At4g27190-like n=1 Tax=Rosa chinensis TaxID=74649 RepID=UPI001AD90C96|nr:disease resistance protein At4g27190-like [Rosa chinensis]